MKRNSRCWSSPFALETTCQCRQTTQRPSQQSQEMDTVFGLRRSVYSVYTDLALGAAGGGAILCVIPFALGGIGFTAGGVAAGSIAAGMGGPAVAAGSLYAGAQSIAAAGFLPSTATAMVTGGAVLNAAAGGVRDYLWRRTPQ